MFDLLISEYLQTLTFEISKSNPGIEPSCKLSLDCTLLMLPLMQTAAVTSGMKVDMDKAKSPPLLTPIAPTFGFWIWKDKRNMIRDYAVKIN